MKNLSLSKRITLFVVVALILSTAIIGVFAYVLQKSEVIDANAQRALAVARTVNAALDADEFSALMETMEPNDYYNNFVDFLNKTMDKCDILYLYVLDSNYDTEVTYFAEGYPSDGRQDADPYTIGDTDPVDIYEDKMYEAIQKGTETKTDVYNLGGYGDMVSAFTPILDKSGKVIGVVGVDLSVGDAISAANRFGLIMIVIIIGICIIAALLLVLFVRTYIGRPIHELETSAEKLAQGDSGFTLTKRRNDEIGRLATAFIRMIDSANEQAGLIERLADGDLTVEVHPRCAEDTVNNSLAKMVRGLNEMMANISTSINQVSVSSNQIADGSQSVAQGSAEQASSIEKLSSGVHTLLDSISHNADIAEKAAVLSGQAKENTEQGNAQMEQMLTAVREINDASAQISKVMKVIDEIAFQTNILALNAAVEAARAGVHGKGFAVVAEEVRNLATKSADAARDSEGLISDSMEKAALGAKIAEATSASLRGIAEDIRKSSELVLEIARAGGEQLSSVGEIDKAVGQVSNVVQQNSAAAEESAAASQEMNSQAIMLGELISQFKLSDNTKRLGHTKTVDITRRLS